MLITLYVFFFFVTYSHAGLITSSDNTTSASSSAVSAQDLLSLNTNTTPSSSQFAVENELAKISTSCSYCFNSKDYEMLAGNFIKHGTARLFSGSLLSNSVFSIGLEELRRALHFAPIRPWKSYNSTEPTEVELASTSNIEAYYDLVEPIPSVLSLDNLYFFEKNIATAIAYLDERLPSIRYIFKRRFEEMHQYDEGLIDRKLIDRMIHEFLAIRGKIEKAVSKMMANEYKCFGIY